MSADDATLLRRALAALELVEEHCKEREDVTDREDGGVCANAEMSLLLNIGDTIAALRRRLAWPLPETRERQVT